MAGKSPMPDTSIEEPPVRTPAPPRVVRPAVDIRRKRPPALSFLLRMDTARRVARVLSLLALDFAGVFAAIFAALMLKAVVRDGSWAWHPSFVEAKESVASPRCCSPARACTRSARSVPACPGSSPRSSRSRSWR
jgi:hypothetical protein